MHPIDRPEPLYPTLGTIIQRTLARCCASSSLPATNAKRFAQGSASDAAIRSGAVEANAEHVPELRPRDHSTTTVANVTALVAGGYHAHAACRPDHRLCKVVQDFSQKPDRNLSAK